MIQAALLIPHINSFIIYIPQRSQQGEVSDFYMGYILLNLANTHLPTEV